MAERELPRLPISNRSKFPQLIEAEWRLPYKVTSVGTIDDANNVRATFNPGLYLIAGGTASGKTTTALAMAYWASLTLPTGYTHINEPRAPTQAYSIFEKEFRGQRSSIVIVDSINAFLEFASTQQRNDTIFKGGLRLSVVQALRDMQFLALSLEKALIGVVNTSVFPIENELEGVFEGRITPKAVGLVEKRDRTLRTNQALTIPSLAMNAAAETLGYNLVVKRVPYRFT